MSYIDGVQFIAYLSRPRANRLLLAGILEGKPYELTSYTMEEFNSDRFVIIWSGGGIIGETNK